MRPNGSSRRRRLIAIAIALLAALLLLDAFVLRRDARAGWLARLPLRVLSPAAALLPSDPALQYALGHGLYAQGRLDPAESAFRRAMALDPAFVLPKAEYANLLIDRGRGAEAYQLTRECFEVDTRLVPALVARGRLHALRGEWLQALQFADRALAVAPDHPPALLLRGRVLARQGSWEEAEPIAARVTLLEPDAWGGWALRAECALERGDAEQAVAWSRRAVQLDADRSEAQRLLGEALLAEEDASRLPEAEAALRRAIRLDPNDTRAQVALGEILVRQERWKEAGGLLLEVLRSRPECNEARALMATLCRRTGRIAEAVRWTAEHVRWQAFAAEKRSLEDRLQRTPYGQEIRLELARLYARMGLWQRALDELQLCLSRGPDPRGLALRQEVLRRLGAAASDAAGPRPGEF